MNILIPTSYFTVLPESKTIEIDEIVTPGESSSSKADQPRSAREDAIPPSDPFADLKRSLGWKTRATLWTTQKFIYLRSKPWGNWVIVPLVLLSILIAIPLGLIFMILLFCRSLLRALLGRN